MRASAGALVRACVAPAAALLAAGFASSPVCSQAPTAPQRVRVHRAVETGGVRVTARLLSRRPLTAEVTFVNARARPDTLRAAGGCLVSLVRYVPRPGPDGTHPVLWDETGGRVCDDYAVELVVPGRGTYRVRHVVPDTGAAAERRARQDARAAIGVRVRLNDPGPVILGAT